MGARLIAILIVVAILAASCVRRAGEPANRPLTGTCEGACTYYLACKSRQGDAVTPHHRASCQRECADIFTSRDSLMALESLGCADLLAFIEGASGRAPGEAPPR
ncbi:MAG: hypothetical protein AAGC55_22095 [Myxococcota bacterium]